MIPRGLSTLALILTAFYSCFSAFAEWDHGFWRSTITGPVNALAPLPNGELLVAGRRFNSLGLTPTYNIAILNFTNGWRTLNALEAASKLPVTNDTVLINGSVIYAGGLSTLGGPALSRYDGFTWEAIPGITGEVMALQQVGDKILAGGTFTIAGNSFANLALWDGQSWSSIGSPDPGPVRAILARPEGIYIGGDFNTIGGKPVSKLARCNGAAWESLAHFRGPAKVESIVGEQDRLYIGGRFTNIGGADFENVAEWDGAAWNNVGGGLNHPSGVAEVRNLNLIDHQLWASGLFFYSGNDLRTGPIVISIGTWDGAKWIDRGPASQFPVYVPVIDLAGQQYTAIPFAPGMLEIARYTATGWEPSGRGSITLGARFLVPAQGKIFHTTLFQTNFWSLASFDGKSSSLVSTIFRATTPAPTAGIYWHNQVFLSAKSQVFGSTTANKIAAWDGSNWLPLGNGLPAAATALHAAGDTLAAGGTFGLLLWDGANWVPTGPDMSSGGGVFALESDSKTLYVGGGFASAAKALVALDLSSHSWKSLGDDFDGAVYTIALGSNGHLYVGGKFVNIGALKVNGIAELYDHQWHALGSGISMDGSSYVLKIALSDSNDLYAGGVFAAAGGITVNNVARWRNGQWAALDGGITSPPRPTPLDMYVQGSDLILAGGFIMVGSGIESDNFAIWHDQPIPPALLIARTSNDHATITFSAPARTGATLERSDDLIHWQHDQTLTLGQLSANIEINLGHSRFFRLISQ
jgi:hypothetical protein